MIRRGWLVALCLCACKGDDAGAQGSTAGGSETGEPMPAGHCDDHDLQRNLYWGDLHVHTSYSFDAWLHDVRSDPDLAYRFAKGEPVDLPSLDAAGAGTQTLSLDRPLDFAAVTDHAEFLAEVSACTTPGSAAYDQPLCVDYRAAVPSALPTFGLELGRPMPARFEEICGSVDCLALAGDVWSRIQQAAEDHYDRSSACTFTTFVGYEWSGMNRLSNLHRNVIFGSQQVPALPISYFEAPTAQNLWQQLDAQCTRGLPGCEVLAIPHNTNWSNGRMFSPTWPEALDAATAQLRAELEPVLEVFQHKGDSECDPAFSAALGAPDELCDFEKLRPPGFEDCGDGEQENTRESVFEALRRRETYGTSGPRIAVRFFGGWDLPEDLCERADMVSVGYEMGVPMGGVLPLSAVEAGAPTPTPTFVVTAQRDPGTEAAPSVGLQRIQIIKGWREPSGELQLRVFDVAGTDDGASVELPACTPVGQGAEHLCATWRDPEHDPNADAFYYVRVLENPTCRWSARDCASLPEGSRPDACDDPTLQRVIQERAWTSPIWYEP